MLNLIAKIGNEIAKWILIGLFFLVIVSNKSKQKFNFSLLFSSTMSRQ